MGSFILGVYYGGCLLHLWRTPGLSLLSQRLNAVDM